MRTLFSVVIAAVALLTMQQVYAQKKKTAKTSTPPAVSKIIPLVDVTLGRSTLTSGNLPKRVFDSLVKQHLQVANGGVIHGFTFSYAEQMMYEDSAGNPLRKVDYLVEYCPGDSLAAGITSSLFYRTKPGDTAFFSQIKVTLPSGQQAAGKTMTFVIGR